MKSELVNKKNISKYSSFLGDAERAAIIKRESSAVGVYDGDKPLGILTFSRTDPPDGKKNKLFFVDHYYVDPEHRGEGIFKTLLEKVREVCRRQKIKGISKMVTLTSRIQSRVTQRGKSSLLRPLRQRCRCATRTAIASPVT